KQLPDINRIQRLRVIASDNNEPGNVISLWLKDGQILPADKNILWQDAIIYSLMTDRYKNGSESNDNPVKQAGLADQANFNGGDFAGISQVIKSGYFDSLGINTLWISPVNKTTNKAYREWPEPHRYFSGYHGYWPVSSTETEPRFGSMQELKNIVQTAHNRNIKILMDFISNHVHIEHPYYKEHRDWFGKVNLPNGEKNIRRWDEYRLTTWFDTFLPSFDYLGSEKALQVMTDNAVWWLKETEVDGFRHDATKHVPYKFWRTLTGKIKKRVNKNHNVNVYQIGETFGGDDLIKSYVNNGMLDAQFNFNQFFVARRVFVEENGNFEDLALAIDKSFEEYGYNHLMGNIMDSHDQVRIMALLEGDLTLSDDGTERAWHEPKIHVDDPLTYQKELVFLTYLLTIPGVPIIYYGDEFGMTGANDPDNRRMMRFGGQLSLREKQQLKSVSQLIHLRKQHCALRRGDYKTLFYNHDVLAYTRGDITERLIIVLNKNQDSKMITIELPDWLKAHKLISLNSDMQWDTNGNKVQFNMAGYSSAVFLVK
ncbi:MAG: alpha-amylase family glycosyl hydrolase, partial [Calditrichaceae bacterium]